MKTKGLCWGCNLPIDGSKHYHDGACRTANKLKQDRQRKAVVRSQGAALNGGDELGKWNKDLASRLAPLVIRSHGEVAKIMGLSSEGVRIIELRALSRIKKLLMPFRGARSGSAKITQTCTPIPSLSD